MLLRLKLWLAERLGIRRLQQAVEYLLLSNLNLRAPRAAGPEGNRALTGQFLALLDALRPTLVCDIGANDGAAAIMLARRLPGCRVLAFEANPAIHARHRAAAEQAGVDYRRLAIAERDGPLTLYAPLTLSRAYVDGRIVPMAVAESPDTGKSSLLRRDEDATYQEFTVDARRLDGVLREAVGPLASQRVALWIDVEGAADRVLAGARETLRHTLAVFVETENFAFWQGQSKSADIARLLLAHDFIPVARDREYADKQFNTLFLRRSALPLAHASLFDIAPAPDAAPAAAPGPAATSAPHRFRTVAGALMADTPILIPAFNNETYVRGMIAQLRARGLRRLLVIDNASTSDSFRAWLDAIDGDVQVVRLRENLGPRHAVAAALNRAALPEWFCVTDPDLALNPELPEDFLAELKWIAERHKVGKVGFALDIADRAALRDDDYEIGGRMYKIWEWEAKFWERPVGATSTGDLCYRAEIDTTFALHSQRHWTEDCPNEAIRVAGRYTCRHLPWYRETGLPAAEEAQYRATQKFSFYLPGGRGAPG